MQSAPRLFTGWGRTSPSAARPVQPSHLEELQEFITSAQPRSLLARGMGRSYGDAAQLDSGYLIDLKAFDDVQLDRSRGTVSVGAGVTLHELLRVLIPSGFFLPVIPGTRNVTLGGAIAADVHGKNHHQDGTFANHVEELWLVDGCGELRYLSPYGPDAPLFWATVAGMGLTGVVTKVTLRLLPISSALVRCTTSRYADLDSLMAAMVAADQQYRYCVAWVDCLNPSGRGVLSCGDHPDGTGSLSYDPRPLANAPRLPVGLLNRLTVRGFNSLWYHRSPALSSTTQQSIQAFFHPLDSVRHWNRIYGPSGFIQYQFAVPDCSADLIPRALAALRLAGAPSFLTVLKRLGPSNPAPLSFPLSGWTLAVDLPAGLSGLDRLLDQLDHDVLAAGGRLYLAKDSRQPPEMLRATYPHLSTWKQHQRELDPRGVFASDLAKRTGLIDF